VAAELAAEQLRRLAMLTDVEEAVVLPLKGQVLDAEHLRAVVRALDRAGGPVVHLDLGEVLLPTAEGLGLLVKLNRRLRARGGQLVLLNVAPDAAEVFEATRLVDVLDVRPLLAG
jgi:anti-anti-sigma factor